MSALIIRNLGMQPYQPILAKMQTFTANRNQETKDELWLLEHYAVYTLGQAGKREHMLVPSTIPIIHADRGGQITYHAPGQLIGYILLDLKRLNLNIRTLVKKLEESLLTLLAEYQIIASTCPGAPGVYIGAKKIASIGLRVKNSCTYHGIALNVAMDLTPFANINPCGFANLKMTQISDYIPNINIANVSNQFSKIFDSVINHVALC